MCRLLGSFAFPFPGWVGSDHRRGFARPECRDGHGLLPKSAKLHIHCLEFNLEPQCACLSFSAEVSTAGTAHTQMPCLLQQQRHQLLPQQHVYHLEQRRWQRHAGTRSRPPATAAQRDQQLTVESSEEDSAKAVAADLRSSGPQRSIHTAAERQQHSLHLQQAITARSSVVDDAPAPSPAFVDSLSSAAVAAANVETSAVNRRDIFRAIFISGVACVLAGVLDHEWVEAHQVSTPTPQTWQRFPRAHHLQPCSCAP